MTQPDYWPPKLFYFIRVATTDPVFLPIGTVYASNDPKPTEGCIQTYGQLLSKSEYSELFAALGDSWSVSETEFRLPDFDGKAMIKVTYNLVGDSDAER